MVFILHPLIMSAYMRLEFQHNALDPIIIGKFTYLGCIVRLFLSGVYKNLTKPRW